MRAVVDTNVVAYCLLGTEPFYGETRGFLRGLDEAHAPDSWRVEILNVMWRAVKAGAVTARSAMERLRLAEGLVTHTCPLPLLRDEAMGLAVLHSHPAYDTVFVALAMREGIPLATWDERVLRRFPDVARRPRDLAA